MLETTNAVIALALKHRTKDDVTGALAASRYPFCLAISCSCQRAALPPGMPPALRSGAGLKRAPRTLRLTILALPLAALVVRVWPATEWELRSPTKNLDDGEAAAFVVG